MWVGWGGGCGGGGFTMIILLISVQLALNLPNGTELCNNFFGGLIKDGYDQKIMNRVIKIRECPGIVHNFGQ